MGMRPLPRRRFLQGSLTLASLGLLSACGIVPPSTQSGRVRRIGVLSSPSSAALVNVFRDSLRELGYVEDQDMSIEYRWAEGDGDRYAALAAELVELQVECIVTPGIVPSVSAKAANSTIPMVAVLANQDAVEGGLVANIARPEGNITGLAGVSGLRLHSKLPEILKEAIPDAARIGILSHYQQPNGPVILEGVKEAASRSGTEVVIATVQDPDGVEPIIAAVSAAGARGLVIVSTAAFNTRREVIASLALAHRLPAISGDDEFARVGGLLAYAVHRPELYRRAATYVDKILKGARPADLPMERPSSYDLVLNLKTAQALGLTIPQSVLQQATEIIY
jgi:putative ABC transport system substrate-binding protein